MADTSLKNLNYGHPGTATFDIANEEWTFVRQYATKQLKQVQGLSELQPSTICTIPTSVRYKTPEVAVNRTSTRKVATNLTGSHPYLAPAIQEVLEPALISKAIQNTTAAHDPLVGNLLSFGTITRRGQGRGRSSQPAVAFATGEAKDILQICILNRQKLGWQEDKTVWVEGLTLKNADCGYWNEDAAPIQQVCFARSEDSHAFVAVRLPARTVILRPLYHKQRQSTRLSSLYHFPASIIDAHPILSIGTDQTGGAAQADVAFNPYFQRQFGIVNQNQSWSIWEIKHGYQRRMLYAVSCIMQGRINPAEDNDDSTGEDGWARILWLGDNFTVLVCSRRHLSIIVMSGTSYSFLPCPSFISDRSGDWILDVQRHPKRKGYVLVLTSVCLTLMAVAASSGGLPNATDSAVANVLVSWNHYRDREDFTLRLSVQMLSDDESCCFLHSQLSNLIQVFTFKDNQTYPSAPILSSDPGVLDLRMDGSKPISHLSMQQMEFEDSDKNTLEPGPGRLYMENGISFYRLFATRSDSSVHETVIYASENELDGELRHLNAIEPFRWNTLKRRQRKASKNDLVDDLDDFIEPNEIYGAVAPRSKAESQIPKWVLSPYQTLLSRELDYSFLYDALIDSDDLGKGKKKSVDTVLVLDKLKDSLLSQSDSSSLLLGTLLEAADTQLEIADIDEASSRLQELHQIDQAQQSVLVQRIATSSVLYINSETQTSMNNLYDDILNYWVQPLPSQTSNRVRQRKERLARRIAAEVMMASSRIRRPETQQIAPEEEYKPSQDNDEYLSALTTELPDPMERDSIEPESSQPLPILTKVDEEPGSQSVATSSVATPSEFFFVPTAQLDPLTRLGKHLRFKDSSTTPTVIPRSINRLLAHWQLESDPSTYDWEESEARFNPEILDDGAREEREKDRRRRERRERRQQREDEMMRMKTASQPVAFPRSSPGPMLGGIGSSSQVPSQVLSQQSTRGSQRPELLVPMSQVEPGKFGGRPDKPKQKKKGRVSGF